MLMSEFTPLFSSRRKCCNAVKWINDSTFLNSIQLGLVTICNCLFKVVFSYKGHRKSSEPIMSNAAWYQTLENMCEKAMIGFHFIFDWMKSSAHFLPQSCSTVMQKQVLFNTHVKAPVLLVNAQTVEAHSFCIYIRMDHETAN